MSRSTRLDAPFVLAMLALVGILAPETASAASLGDIVKNFGTDIASHVPGLLVGAAYLMGIWLTASGLTKLKDGHDRGEKPHADGLLRLGGGASLAALPQALGVGLHTVYGTTGFLGKGAGGASPGSLTDCTAGGADALTCVAKNIGTNLVPVFVQIAFVMFFIMGAAMVFHAIYTMAKSQAGGQHQLPKGWFARLVIGILCLNTPHLLNAIQTTLGIGTGTIDENGFQGGGALGNIPTVLQYTASGSVAILQQYQTLIGWIFVILVMFGIIAVLRGLVLLRAYAEGNSQGTMGAGMAHIVGGVLLANGKFTTCAVVSTFIGGQALGFCS